MTLFTLLLALTWERLFKKNDRWQIDTHLEMIFRRLSAPSFIADIAVSLVGDGRNCCVAVAGEGGIIWAGRAGRAGRAVAVDCNRTVVSCGAGEVRQHYQNYLGAAQRGEQDAMQQALAEELALIHGLPLDATEREKLIELQNALLWLNFRFYLAPLFWFVVAGPYGPIALVGYAILRARQTCLARHHTPLARAQSGVDALLRWLDWIPARLAGITYALLGHGEKALPAWLASLGDLHHSPYWVVTQLAQFSLVRESHTDPIDAPRAAVILAKKVSVVMVVAVAALTIYGTLL